MHPFTPFLSPLLHWSVRPILVSGLLLFGQLIFPVSDCIGQTAMTSSTVDPTVQTPQITSSDLIPQQLRNKVRIVVDKKTNTLTIVGTKADIEIVRRTILSLRQKLATHPQTIMAKIRLEHQLADSVVEIVENALQAESQGTRLRISALHFPESILLVGPPAAVKWAQELVRKVDDGSLYTLEYRQ